MTGLVHWLVAGGWVRILGAWVIVAALVSLALGRMIRSADHDVYDDDRPADVAHVDALAEQMRHDEAWARGVWFPGGQR